MDQDQNQIIKVFIRKYFHSEYSEPTEDEKNIIESCLIFVRSRFVAMKYILGTAMDFTILAQLLSDQDSELRKYRPDFSLEKLFQRYKLVTIRGERKANTLSLSFNDGRDIGIRRIEENVLEFFHSLNRTDYPSAYVYNTGQWQKYQDMLESIFQLSENGRYWLLNELIRFGLETLPENKYYERRVKRKRLFERIIEEFERGNPNENGGLIFQAIAFAFYKCDFHHLCIVTDKVRTGSSRQRRFGDIDCYYGLDLELSVEVKDFLITEDNYKSQLGQLISNVGKSDFIGIAFVKNITEEAARTLNSQQIKVITEADLLDRICLWDFQKQEIGVQSMLHYIAHIEQDAGATQRLLEFIALFDPNHPSLYFRKIQSI
jgi:hypothetical protein